MREIKDTKRIEQIYQTVQHCFRLRPPVLRLLQFEKEELLNHPLRPQEQFLIVAEGSVAIYDLSEDGGIRYVSRTGTGTLLGDVEFCGADGGAFYTGAAERVLCLAIPFAENRETLEDDPGVPAVCPASDGAETDNVHHGCHDADTGRKTAALFGQNAARSYHSFGQ